MVKAEKVESFGASCEVRDPGLLRVQSQPDHVQDRRHQLAGLLGLFAGGAEDHEVIAVPDQRPQPLRAARPRFIERVQGDVGEQR
jgi:hypothetical protein